MATLKDFESRNSSLRSDILNTITESIQNLDQTKKNNQLRFNSGLLVSAERVCDTYIPYCLLKVSLDDSNQLRHYITSSHNENGGRWNYIEYLTIEQLLFIIKMIENKEFTIEEFSL